jgi:hypothetical protein
MVCSQSDYTSRRNTAEERRFSAPLFTICYENMGAAKAMIHAN